MRSTIQAFGGRSAIPQLIVYRSPGVGHGTSQRMAEPDLVEAPPRWMVGSTTESGRRVPIGSGQSVPFGADYQIWPTGGLPPHRQRSIITEPGRAHSTRNTVIGTRWRTGPSPDRTAAPVSSPRGAAIGQLALERGGVAARWLRVGPKGPDQAHPAVSISGIVSAGPCFGRYSLLRGGGR